MSNQRSQVSWKRTALRAFIGSIVLSALLGIWALLAGEFGDLEVKVLLSSLSISGASLTAMGGAALLESRRERIPSLPAMVLSCGALVLVLIGIWSEVDEAAFWKTVVTASTFAVGCSHVSLLRLARLSSRFGWVPPATATTVLLLVLFANWMVWGEIGAEGAFRVLGVLSILVAAATLATPVLHRLGREDLVLVSSGTDGRVSMLCPSCANRFRSSLGDVVCPRCAVRFRIELEA